MHNIFAYTEPTPDDGFPAYLSINRDNKGRLFITVRSRRHTSIHCALADAITEAREMGLAEIGERT